MEIIILFSDTIEIITDASICLIVARAQKAGALS